MVMPLNKKSEMKKTFLIFLGILFLVNLGCSQQQFYPISEGFITTKDGIRLYYQKVGGGPEVVIIPGGMYLSYEFERLVTKDRTLLFYDQRSRGRSEAINDKSKLGIKYELSDLESIRTYFGYEKVSLIGWSYSGAVVALYAIEHPDVAKRIIQIGSIPPRRDPYFNQFILTLSSRRDSSELALLDDIYKKFQETGNLKEYIQDYYELSHKALKYDSVKEERFRKDFYTLENERPDRIWNVVLPTIIESLGNWDFRKELSNITIPVLTIHGDYDAIPMESAREWCSLLPNNRLLIVHQAGHLPWFERPNMVFNALDSFLRGEWPENAEDLQEANNRVYN